MSYIFNTKAPPLLSEVDNIIDVPSESLLKRVGDSQWDAFRTKKTGGGSGSFPTVKRVLKIKTHYKMSRRLQWVVDQAPMHYSTDVSFEQTIKEGYSEQRKTTMEKSLGISAGASIPFAGLGDNQFRIGPSGGEGRGFGHAGCSHLRQDIIRGGF